MGVISIVMYALMNFLSGGNVIADSVTAIGVWIAFYYGLTGWTACVLPQDAHAERSRPHDERCATWPRRAHSVRCRCLELEGGLVLLERSELHVVAIAVRPTLGHRGSSWCS